MEETIPISYNLDVFIEPSKYKLYVEGYLKLENTSKQKQINFDIHETFQIEKLKVNAEFVDYKSEKNEPVITNPASKRISFEIPENKDEIKIDFSYFGELKDIPEWNSQENQEIGLDDRINPDHIELACYSCWYPFFGFGHDFDIDLKVSVPKDWILVCSGKKKNFKIEEDRLIEDWISKKDKDIVIIASPNFKKERISGSFGNFIIYYTKLPEDFIKRHSREVEDTINLFEDILGRCHLSGELYKTVYSPREKGQGGYSRNGMIVTSEGLVSDILKEEPNRSFLRGTAHEIAHFWWNFGRGQLDWINETFAEYFSLLAVEKILSKGQYDEYIKEYEEKVNDLPKDAPSLSEVDPINTEINYTIRYYKGALMLKEFRKMLGDKIFLDSCREFYKKFSEDSIDSNKFEQFWRYRLGEKEDLIDIWLKSKGGLPDNY